MRIFELDAYAHTNHTVFLQWLEEGREGLLQDLGRSFLRFRKEGTPLVMVNLAVDYLGQVGRGDEVTVETRIGHLGRTSVRFDHRVLLDGDRPVLEGKALMVFIGPEDRPVPIPGDFRDLFEQ